MRCRLYMKTLVNNSEYFGEIEEETFFGAEFPLDVVRAIELLLGEQFKLGEVVEFEELVRIIEEKKTAGLLSMPLHYYAANDEGLDSYAFFRACNILEFILGFSQGLGRIPLENFGIGIAQGLSWRFKADVKSAYEQEGNVNCELFVEAEKNGRVYHVPFKDKPFIIRLSFYTARAMLLLLDDEFNMESMINFEVFINKLEEKRKEDMLLLSQNYSAKNTKYLSPSAFFNACNVLEYIRGFAMSLGSSFPLDIFSIRFYQVEKLYAGLSAQNWKGMYMHCTLYIKAEHGEDVYYVPIIEKLLFDYLFVDEVRAMQILLDNCFTIGEYANLKVVVDKIKEKKLADVLVVPSWEEYVDGVLQPSKQDFYKATMLSEYLYNYAKRIDAYPLDIFAIKFEYGLDQKKIKIQRRIYELCFICKNRK